MRNCTSFPFGKLCLTLCIGMILRLGVAGQCPGGLSTQTYDTVLSGIGYGAYALRFPQWNPDSGTLLSVTVSARVTVQYAFTLTDVDAVAGLYTLRVGREDHFTSAAMAAPYENIIEKQIGVYSLDPGAVLTQPPFLFLDDYANTDSITINTVPFQGTGSVDFIYSPITYTDLRSNNNASYGYHATAQDAMHFSVSYLYCNGQVALATGLTRWSAMLDDPLTVQLAWSAASEPDGRRYDIQRSGDGKSFATVATVAGGGMPAEYGYKDALPADGGATWYYRLMIADPGHLSYSDIRVVNTVSTAEKAIVVYPNPAQDFVNMVIGGGGAAGGWQVDLYTAAGNLVQRGHYSPASMSGLRSTLTSGLGSTLTSALTSALAIRVNFQQKMSPGVYFLRATDLAGRYSYFSSFIVTGLK
jgi:hypothetical protein